MPSLEDRIDARIRARAASRAATRQTLAETYPTRPNPIFGQFDDVTGGSSTTAPRLEDSLPPMEIRSTTGLRKILDDAAAGTGALNPIRALSPIYQGGRAAAEFVNQMAVKPLVQSVSPIIGQPDLSGLPEWMGPGDPQLPARPLATRESGGVTLPEKIGGMATTGVNLAWPGAQGLLTKELAGLGLGSAASRIAGSSATGATLLGAHGGLEGAMAPAETGLERAQQAIRGGAAGAEQGALIGAIAHTALGEAAPWVARGMLSTAKIAARAVPGTAALLEDFSLKPGKFAENRDVRKIMGGLEEDLNRPRPASAADRRILSTMQPPSREIPQGPTTPAAGEGIPAGDISSVRPWPKGSVKKEHIFTPGNLARFERMKSKGLPGDEDLRARIRAGEDLTDAEVHRAEPNNLTVYDILKVPHPTNPGTTIGAEVKRMRIRGSDMLPPRTAVEPLTGDLNPDEVISGLERTRAAKGGDEFGDVNDVIQRVKADQEKGIPLTLGRLRVHQRDAMLEHGQQIAKEHGIELRQDGVVIILAGPPGSGKSTIANRVGKALHAYQVDPDFGKVRDPRYQDVGAAGVHEESSELALRAKNLALARRDNIVVPMIGKDPKYIREWMAELKASGHTVYYVLADLSPEEASVRAFNRSLGKGRVVGPDYVLNSVGRKPQATFDLLKGESDLVGGRFVRLDQSHPPSVPLLDRVLEHGPGFDRSLLDETTAGRSEPGRAGPDNRPGGGSEPAPERGVDRGIPRTAGPAVPPGDLQGPRPSDVAGDVDLFGAPVAPDRPAGPEPWSIHKVPTEQLHLDPVRFQWKQDVDAATGAGKNLKGSKRYNPQLAGTIDVWRDPADGKDYVINGHHRYSLALRDGVQEMHVRYIDAANAKEARTWGAVRNIASGKGTALDVAKFLHDSGETIDGLAERGVDLKSGLAREGVAIAKLPQDLITKLTQDPQLIRKGAIIGEILESPDQQRAAFAQAEKLTERQLAELAKVIRQAGSENVENEDLFGSSSMAKSLFVEKAKVAAAIREKLAGDRRTFGFVSKEGRAADLERGGNKIDVGQSRAIATQAAQVEELFDRLYQRGGPLGDLMDNAARRVANGEKPGPVASSIYDRIRKAAEDEVRPPLARAGRAGSDPSTSGAMLGGVSGSGLGGVAGGTIGAQIGDTPEERRRNAALGAAIGFGAGGLAGGAAGKVALETAERTARPVRVAPDEAPLFDVRATPKRVSVRIQGEPSTAQLNDLITQIRTNPGAGFRYSLRDLEGRSVSGGKSLAELFADRRFGRSNPRLTGGRPGGGLGAIGDQPDMFGHVAPEAEQGGLFGDEVGTAATQVKAGKPFEQVKEEARLNADFLRKQLLGKREIGKRSPPRLSATARENIATQIAALDRIAGFNDTITKDEMRIRAMSGRPGAIGDQPVAFGPPKKAGAIGDQPEHIVQSAVRTPDGKHYTGDWHSEAIDKADAALERTAGHGAFGPDFGDSNYDNAGWSLGFETSKGRFVSRDEAFAIARDAGQEPKYVDSTKEGKPQLWSGTYAPPPGGRFRNRIGAMGDQPSPYREPADRGAYKGESDLLNISKIVEGSSAQERIADAAEKYRGMKESQKKTWAEQDPAIQKAIDDLLAGDRKAAKPHIARKLTGAQILARRDVVRQNDAMIESLSKQIESKTLPVAEHEKAVELLQKAVEHNDALLSDIVTGASQKGRDLNLLKRMANQSLDHDVWQIQAKRMLGDRPLSDETAAQLRKLVTEAQEACK